jgi:hypothetical protein
VFVTAGTAEHDELLADLVDEVRSLGLDARVDDGAIVLDGSRVVPVFCARAHPTPADLSQLLAEGAGRSPVVVVADRISDAGRDVLRAGGWGWLDRRGHLRLWAPGLRLESPLHRDAPSRPRGSNLWTTVGLEVALHAVVHPDQPCTARRVAPVIGRSVGATHERIARFVDEGLIGPRTHRPLMPELFWETAANWPDDDWLPLPLGPVELAERLATTDLVRVDERAATLGGARIAAAGDLPARCYVRTAGLLRRARNLADRDAPVRCWVRRAPVEWLPLNDEHPPDDAHPWQVAHPVLCALRLAADPARGREIVEDWGLVDAVADGSR